MKLQAIKMFGIFAMLGIFLSFTNDCLAQDGTAIRTSDRPSDTDFFSVTKTYEFDAGGIEINPISGSADYVVYEKKSKSSAWTKSDQGKLDDRAGKLVKVCKTSAAMVKVEIKTKCEDCVAVRQVGCE